MGLMLWGLAEVIPPFRLGLLAELRPYDDDVGGTRGPPLVGE